jgi:hypothetical protein
MDLDQLEKLLALMEHGKNGEYRPGGGTDDCRVWTGRVDENGYPDPRISIEVADCSMSDTQKRHREPKDEEVRKAQAHFARNVGRAIAALLNAAPELIRLAKIGKIVEAHCPEDGSSDLAEKLDEAGAFKR